MADRVYCRLGR